MGHHSTRAQVDLRVSIVILKWIKENVPMHPRLEEVLNYLDSERSALSDAVGLVPAQLRDQSPGPIAGRWRRCCNTS